MSDHAEKKKDEKPAEGGDGHGDAKKKAGIAAMLTKLPVLLGGAMVIEAAVMLVAFKLLAGGPKAADASVSLDTHTEEKSDEKKPAEEGHGAASKEEDGHAAAKEEAGGHGAAAEEKPAEGHGEAKSGGNGESAEKSAEAPSDPNKQVEIQVVEFRAPNKLSGKTFLYDVSIYAVASNKNKAKLETAVKERGALIKDRVRTIIAQSDPEKLGGGAEPGLETLRRQVRFVLEQIVGEGIVEDVLVPRCIGFRTDY